MTLTFEAPAVTLMRDVTAASTGESWFSRFQREGFLPSLGMWRSRPSRTLTVIVDNARR